MAITIEPLEFEINPQLIGEGITQSEMQTFDNCPEKWYLKYNKLLTKKGNFSWALTFGHWIHASLEEFYATKGKRWSWNPTIDKAKRSLLTGALLEKEEYWDKVGKCMLDVYTSHYKHDPEFFKYKTSDIENIVDLEWEGFRLKGMIDLKVGLKGKTYILDHKTTSRIDSKLLMGWDFRFQFMFYCWLARKKWPKETIGGWIPNGLKKPEIRQGKDESLDTFIARLREDMLSKPDKYFYREIMDLPKGQMERFEEHILRPKLARFKMFMDPKTPPSVKTGFLRNKNTDHCIAYGSACEFLPVCQHGMKIEGFNYQAREAKHEELQDATE